MSKKYIQIIEDIEEALTREVKRMVFFDARNRSSIGLTFKEMFDPFTGKLVRKPIEARTHAQEAESLLNTSPRFDLFLLKLYEDLETKRLLPPYGEEFVEPLPGPGAYEPVFAGNDAKTTDGGTGSTVEINHRKIRRVEEGHGIRLLCSDGNDGTYRIESITLNGNGPHTLTLSNNLIIDIPTIQYDKDAGIITFSPFLDLEVVRVGDLFYDNQNNSFAITAIDVNNSTIAIAPGSAVATGSGGKIYRTGDVLQYDDAGADIKYVILDLSQPITDKSTKYRKCSQRIPYTFLYYIKIISRERDDHIAIADRMMQVFNPPRGSLCVIARSQTSAETELVKDVDSGNTVIYVKDASKFYTNDTVRLMDSLGIGEEVTVKSVNHTSNSITLKSAVVNSYDVDDDGRMVSNYDFCTFERDFTNHQTDDREDEQLWIHRFTFRIEGWIESRIDNCALDASKGGIGTAGEKTYEDVGDVNFVEYVLEDLEGNELEDPLVP